MTHPELTVKYLDELAREPEAIVRARDSAAAQGIRTIAPALGAHIAVLASLLDAKALLEIGTGTGVSAGWLVTGAPAATLTSIDTEFDLQQKAKHTLVALGMPPTRARLITGNAVHVLPRMNEASYDIVLIDAGHTDLLEYVEHALRLARPGGLVLVTDVLFGGRIADPANREDAIADVRALLAEFARTDAVHTSIVPLGSGLLVITKSRDAS